MNKFTKTPRAIAAVIIAAILTLTYCPLTIEAESVQDYEVVKVTINGADLPGVDPTVMPTQIIATMDGGYAATGFADGFATGQLIKYTPSGSVAWSTQIPLDGHIDIDSTTRSLTQLDDGSFIVKGNAGIYKIDSGGNITQSKAMPCAATGPCSLSLARDSDGNVVVVEQSSDSGNVEYHFMKYNSDNLTLIWEATKSDPNDHSGGGVGVIAHNGIYYVMGGTILLAYNHGTDALYEVVDTGIMTTSLMYYPQTDSDGNIFMTGVSDEVSCKAVSQLINPTDGSVIWRQESSMTFCIDTPLWGSYIDSADNYWAVNCDVGTGDLQNIGSACRVIEYDSTGNQILQRVITANTIESYFGAVATNGTSIFVGGMVIYGGELNDYDISTIEGERPPQIDTIAIGSYMVLLAPTGLRPSIPGVPDTGSR
jgi:hypothetical protein